MTDSGRGSQEELHFIPTLLGYKPAVLGARTVTSKKDSPRVPEVDPFSELPSSGFRPFSAHFGFVKAFQANLGQVWPRFGPSLADWGQQRPNAENTRFIVKRDPGHGSTGSRNRP